MKEKFSCDFSTSNFTLSTFFGLRFSAGFNLRGCLGSSKYSLRDIGGLVAGTDAMVQTFRNAIQSSFTAPFFGRWGEKFNG